MPEFAKYYLDFIIKFFQNAGTFIVSIFNAFVKFFGRDVGEYFKAMAEASREFNLIAWVCLILVSIINFVLVFFVCYRIFQFFRRYIIFRSKEVDKDELIEEVARLREQTEELTQEKAQIFALKMNDISGLGKRMGDSAFGGRGAAEEEKTEVAQDGQSRFSKLITIDEQYKDGPHTITMQDSDMFSLKEIVDRFVNFAASQLNLYYKPQTAMFFIAGMATSKVIILEGISGTGKTSLPYGMAKFFSNYASIVSVQPSWRDRAELLGYLNEFTKRFNETDFLARLYETTYREDLNLIVLDEMNLARIEYYFAEFLSIMEMPDTSEWKIDLIPNPMPETDPRNFLNGKILVPQNIWFVGTANQDDSTFTVTDKVYDRAVSIDLNTRGKYFDAPLTPPLNISYDYLDSLFNKALNSNPVSPETLKKLSALDEFITAKFRISFGNRILKQMRLFIPVYIACGGDEYEGLDFMVRSKILRKFTALNLVFLQKELVELSVYFDKEFGRGKFVLCQDYIKLLQKNL